MMVKSAELSHMICGYHVYNGYRNLVKCLQRKKKSMIDLDVALVVDVGEALI